MSTSSLDFPSEPQSCTFSCVLTDPSGCLADAPKLAFPTPNSESSPAPLLPHILFQLRKWSLFRQVFRPKQLASFSTPLFSHILRPGGPRILLAHLPLWVQSSPACHLSSLSLAPNPPHHHPHREAASLPGPLLLPLFLHFVFHALVSQLGNGKSGLTASTCNPPMPPSSL